MSIQQVPERICFHCGISLADEKRPDEHSAECGLKRLRKLEEAISDDSNTYATRLLNSRELLAELVIIFGGREHQIRSFINGVTSGNEITAAIMRKLPSVVADTALLDRVRLLKEPLILRHQ